MTLFILIYDFKKLKFGKNGLLFDNFQTLRLSEISLEKVNLDEEKKYVSTVGKTCPNFGE
jgi:hypothetical protein